MASNSRLTIAVHTLGILAFQNEAPINSKLIAESVGTNPVVIRRIVGNLAKHGLVEVKMGTGGGAKLTRAPENIRIGEIYLALEEDEIFNVPEFNETHCCQLGRLVRPVLGEILDDAEKYLIAKLNEVSLLDVMKKVGEKLPKDFCVRKSNG